MIRKISLPILIALISLGPFNTKAQSHHDHEPGHSHTHSSQQDQQAIPQQAKLVTGQGDFIFSWDKELSSAFPTDAIEFESGMHGGFNEDPQTGIVYTGIPGYGLCSISADLKQWTRIGSDERLKKGKIATRCNCGKGLWNCG